MVFMNNRLLPIMMLACSLLITSCKKTDKILFSYINSKCPQGGVINLKEALNVVYDTAYLFSECTNNQQI